MGQTQFGRGGGASTSPCGWWVVYTYEAPGPRTAGGSTAVSTWNLEATHADAKVNMWTDGAIQNTLSVALFAFLATLLN